MTPSEAAPKLDLEQVLVRAADTALVEAFGCRFDLWAPADRWCRVSSGDPPTAIDPPGAVAELFERSQATGPEPLLTEQARDRHLLVIPIWQNGKVRLVATADFETSAPELLMKLARLFVREFDQREQLQRHAVETGAYLVEITQNLEELVFLRQMADYLELSELSHDRWELAETVLPVLRNSIKAEGLALVPTQDDGRSCDGANAAVGQPTLWVGPCSTDGETCRRLVEQYRHLAAEQPVVKNGFHQMPEGARFPGVREFLLVPMSAAGRVAGWLLAVNRVAAQGFEPQDGRCVLGEMEFGTVEAGLVSSAASILATHARNVELFEQKGRLFLDAIRSLVFAVDAKDPYTSGHSERVALFARRLGQELGLDEEACRRLYLGGLLHDVGKIGIRGAILRKAGRLTDEEFAEIKQHAERSWTMLHDLPHLQQILPGIVHHHEEFDGSGYPDGLTGEEIPLDARILSVADAYDAMTSDRPYRKNMPQEKVDAILRQGAGTQWDARVVEAFFDAVLDMVAIRQSYRPRPQPRRKPDCSAIPLVDTTQICADAQPASEP